MTAAPMVVERGRREKYFSAVPPEMVFSDLAPRAIKVYCALLQYGNGSGERCPSMKGLAKRMGMNPKTVSAALDDLEAAGWIDVERDRHDGDGHRKTNRYFVHECLPGADSQGPESGDRDEGLGPKNPDGIFGPDLDNQETPNPDHQESSGEPNDDTRPEVEQLCQYLEQRAADHLGRKPKRITAQARKDMDRLLRLGELGLAEPEPVDAATVRKAIDVIFDELNVQQRGFCWADQILSPGSLRERWSKLRKAARDQRAKTSENGASPDEAFAAAVQADATTRTRPEFVAALGDQGPRILATIEAIGWHTFHGNERSARAAFANHWKTAA